MLLRWTDEHPSLYMGSQPGCLCFRAPNSNVKRLQQRPLEVLESSPNQPTVISVLHARPFLSFIDEEAEAENVSKYYQTTTSGIQRQPKRSRKTDPDRPTVASFIRWHPMAM